MQFDFKVKHETRQKRKAAVALTWSRAAQTDKSDFGEYIQTYMTNKDYTRSDRNPKKVAFFIIQSFVSSQNEDVL